MLVSVTDGVTAETLPQHPDKVEALQNAYSMFAETMATSLGAAKQFLRRRRRLLVLYEYDSAEVYKFVDTPCSETVTTDGVNCITVFGRYYLLVEEEEGEETPQAIYEKYVERTQAAIDNGALEESLKEVAPNSTLTVEGTSTVVDAEHVPIPATDPPVGTKPPKETSPPAATESPMAADDGSSGTGGSGGTGTGGGGSSAGTTNGGNTTDNGGVEDPAQKPSSAAFAVRRTGVLSLVVGIVTLLAL